MFNQFVEIMDILQKVNGSVSIIKTIAMRKQVNFPPPLWFSNT